MSFFRSRRMRMRARDKAYAKAANLAAKKLSPHEIQLRRMLNAEAGIGFASGQPQLVKSNTGPERAQAGHARSRKTGRLTAVAPPRFTPSAGDASAKERGVIKSRRPLVSGKQL